MKKWVLLWMLCAGLTAQGQVAFDVDYGALQKRVCRLCDKEQSPERRALVQDLKKDYTIVMVTRCGGQPVTDGKRRRKACGSSSNAIRT